MKKLLAQLAELEAEKERLHRASFVPPSDGKYDVFLFDGMDGSSINDYIVYNRGSGVFYHYFWRPKSHGGWALLATGKSPTGKRSYYKAACVAKKLSLKKAEKTIKKLRKQARKGK